MADHENTILRALLAHRAEFVSGEKLAEQLGISRVAVWQHMEKLRAEGFAFEAVRNVGYRIEAFPSAPHAALLTLLVGERAQTPEIFVHETLESTNDEATRQLTAGCATPRIVLALRQTRGRGRFGRPWHSEPNGNLYLSFAFHPRVTPTRMQTFTLWMGVNLCDFIAAQLRATKPDATPPGVKWPNDLLFGARKVGGMLTEARIDADQIRDLIFGLGLNLNSDAARWPSELADRATSLAEQNGGMPLDTNTFAAALITRVLDAYEQFIEAPEAAASALSVLWKKHDLLHGKSISVIYGKETNTGIASGIDAEGSLLVRNGPGERAQKFRAGEVTIGKNTAFEAQA